MICVLSPTGLIPWFSKTEWNTYATLFHHPFLFGEIQRSAQEVARRISGDVAGESAQKSTYQVPIKIRISRITLFAICLSFSSPPLHPCRFIRPLSFKSDRSHVVLWAKELIIWFVFLSPLGLRLLSPALHQLRYVSHGVVVGICLPKTAWPPTWEGEGEQNDKGEVVERKMRGKWQIM